MSPTRCRRMSRNRMSTGRLMPRSMQVIGQLLQIDRARRILRRVHEHVARGGDREVALAPALHLVELGGIADGEGLSGLPVAVTARRGAAHANMIHTFSLDSLPIDLRSLGEASARAIAIGALATLRMGLGARARVWAACFVSRQGRGHQPRSLSARFARPYQSASLAVRPPSAHRSERPPLRDCYGDEPTRSLSGGAQLAAAP